MPYFPFMHPTLFGADPGRRVLSVQYFLHFGIMGIVLPYFNLYCFHIGLTGFEIGVISGLRSASLVLFSLMWGAIADRYAARKPLYIFCLFASAGFWSLYLATVDFWMISIITVFYGIFYSPIIAFLEAFTMDALGTEKKDYGTVRAWGSAAFIAVVILMGKLIDRYTVDIILVLVLLGASLQSLFSLRMPRIPVSGKKRAFSFPKTLLRKEGLLFLGCAFLMLMSHGAYYGFFSIHLETLGYSKTFMGCAWSLASICEIGVMIRSGVLFDKFTLRTVLVFSFLAAATRWCSLFFFRSAISILLTQCLHAFTYGTFHMASILYMDTLTPEEGKTLGQAVNNAVTYGLGLMIGFFLAGTLYEPYGARVLFAVSSLIALLGGILFYAMGKNRGSLFPS